MLGTKGTIGKYYNLARCLWGTLIILAILSRAIIPAGMMPDFQSSQQGIFKLTICSGDGMKTINVPADQYDGTEHSQQKQIVEPCPYAVGVSTATLVLAVILLLFVEVVRVLWIGLPPVRLSFKPFITNAYPRAPPVFS